MDRKFALLFAILITGLIASNVYIFSVLSSQNNIESAYLSRVIDGDTIVIDQGTRIRLANINTPETGQTGFEEAKQFLEQYQGNTIGIEYTDIGRYGREIARVYSPEGIYLNLNLVEEGLANKFLVENSEKSLFYKTEEKAIQSEKGIWEKSEFFGCFESEVFPEDEKVILTNDCDELNIDGWFIMDESRKKYIFPHISIGTVEIQTHNGENNETHLFWNNSRNIWNNNRDTVYFFDSEGKIALYHPYRY